MPKNTLIISLFLLSFFSAKAQYLGGSGDGHAMAETNNVVLGTDEVTFSNPSLIIYPNPSRIESGFTIYFRSSTLWNWLEIYDVTGKLKHKVIVSSSGNLKINLSGTGIKTGVYILKIRSSNGRSTQRKIVLTD